jgi:hypothetical protein
MKKKFYRANNVIFRGPEASAEGTTISVTGTVIWTKAYSSIGVAYRVVGASNWTHKASSSKEIDMNITGATAGATYEVAWDLKRASGYDYGSAGEVAGPGAEQPGQ